ncbi:MAG: AzlD domain-containing protein [Gammaproteobacteria bacterium]
MQVRGEILILILLCALVTVVPRVLPFLAAHRMRLSPRAVAWFRFLPAAILSALLLPSLLLPGGEWPKTVWSPEIAAAFVAAAVALKTRGIILTIVAGMLSYAALSGVFA